MERPPGPESRRAHALQHESAGAEPPANRKRLGAIRHDRKRSDLVGNRILNENDNDDNDNNDDNDDNDDKDDNDDNDDNDNNNCDYNDDHHEGFSLEALLTGNLEMTPQQCIYFKEQADHFIPCSVTPKVSNMYECQHAQPGHRWSIDAQGMSCYITVRRKI